MTRMILVLISTFFGLISNSQKNNNRYPEIGKTCPDYTFTNIRYFKTKKASIKDFRGKWLIMDFGGPNCASCIASIPEYDSFQKEFGNQLQVILIEDLGPTSYYTNKKLDPNWPERTYALYEKIRQKTHFDLPVAYDSMLNKQYRIGGMPYILILDPKGTVKFITSEVTRDNIITFLSGGNPVLEKAAILNEGWMQHKYNVAMPLLTNGGGSSNGGSDTSFIYRSLLTQWNEYQGSGGVFSFPGQTEALAMDLSFLYKLAFFGAYDWNYENTSLYGNCSLEVVLLTKDSVLFHTNGIYSSTTKDKEHTYSYSLKMPGLNANCPPPCRNYNKVDDRFQRKLQQDLDVLFPYTASIESLPCPVYFLEADNKVVQNLKAKEDTSFTRNLKGEGLFCKNITTTRLAEIIVSDVPRRLEFPVINRTNIEYKIDLDLNCNMTNINEIKEALLKNGLQLIEGKKEMKVLVISDKVVP